MNSEEKHNARIAERRKRLEAAIAERRKRLCESQEKKRALVEAKEAKEKELKVAALEERVTALEKVIAQMRLDFSRYRARNK